MESALYETNAPRVYLVRDDGGPAGHAALVANLRTASRGGTVAVVLEVDAVQGVDPAAFAFWLSVLQDREADVGVVAVVSTATSVRLATVAFGAMASLRHLPVEVRAHPSAGAAIPWASEALARAAAARRLAGAERR